MFLKAFFLCILYDVFLACPFNFFGPSCRYKCNCQKTCDKYGECLPMYGCNLGWFGFLCQLKDLLRTVPTPTLTTIPATGRGTVTNFSQALVDRNPYTCAEDLRSVNMTFAVPTHLTVLRLQGARLAYIGRKPGAIITASNDNFKTSVCSDGSRVFEVDTLNAEDSTVDVYCNTLVPATHFRITIRDFRRVCTVYASDACTLSYSRLPCPDDYCKRCFNEMCDMATGQCKIGCLGYSNFPYCDKACLKGYFGLNCLFKCSSCFNGNCDPSSGLCLKGCDGFSDPPMCTIPCEKSHGFNCSCSQTCQKCRKASRLCEMCLPDHRLNISDPSTCIPIPKIQRGFLSSTLLPNGSPIALSIFILETFLVIVLVVLLVRCQLRTPSEHQSEAS